MKILVTGGCGYVGSALVPNLIKDGHEVTVVDAQWFGNNLEPNRLLKVEKLHLSEIKESNLIGIDCVVHLANIANDPSVDLNPVLSWEVNTLHTTQLLELCKKVNIKKFIYASSGSVYGVKDENNVTEDLSLVPISAYNKTKMVAERVCLSYEEHFNVYCIRPATVCGLSPRMRFDVVVNMFVLQAFTNNQITVLGGEQVRPNIHIKDMVRVYQHFLVENDIQSGCYNAGFENLKVYEIAEKVAKIFGCEIVVKDSNDPRSYRQDSKKLLNTGFVPLSNVSNAIEEIRNALKDRKIFDRPDAHTVEWMKENNFDGMINSGA